MKASCGSLSRCRRSAAAGNISRCFAAAPLQIRGRARSRCAAPSVVDAPISDPAGGGDAHTVSMALLRWACSGWSGSEQEDDGTPAAAAGRASTALRVAVRDLGPGLGRGLVAAADLAPGETLLSVPLTRVFTSEPDSELHWSAEMALRLLRARHLASPAGRGGAGASGAEGAAGAAAGADGPEGLGEAGWEPWLRALPPAVRTPLEYGDDGVRQLGCPYVMEEVRVMQQCVRDCYEVLQPELEALQCGWEDFLWAVQVFHSRCFFEPTSGCHMCVPGVDMANHSAAPSAGVRLLHSPGACQGYDAVAEIAEPPPPEPSRFTLVVGEAGIRCGDEVTISYGRWPSEAFLLLFGFVPGGGGGPSPGDCLTLFADGEEAVRWCLEVAADRRHGQRQQRPRQEVAAGDASTPSAPHEAGDDLERGVEAVLGAVYEAVPGDDLLNLAVMPEGIDGRLQALLSVVSRQPYVDLSPRDLLLHRIRERLAHFDNAHLSVHEEAIGAFLQSKRALALHALTQLS